MLEQELKDLQRDAARWRAFSNLARKKIYVSSGNYRNIHIWQEYPVKLEDLELQEFLRIEKEEFDKSILEFLGVE